MEIPINFWSLYLEGKINESLIRNYKSLDTTLPHFKRWIMAMFMTKYNLPSEDVKGLTESYKSDAISSDELKNIVLTELQHSVFYIEKKTTDLSNNLLIAETWEVDVDTKLFSPWELSFLAQHSEISCASIGIEALNAFEPLYYKSPDVKEEDRYISATLKVRVDSQLQKMFIRGCIYFAWNRFSSSTYQENKKCQTLHRLLHDLNLTTLPEISTKFNDSGTFNAEELVLQPGNDIQFPRKCDFSYFKTKNYLEEIATYFPMHVEKLRVWSSLSVHTRLTEFLASRETYYVGDWLSHRVQPQDTVQGDIKNHQNNHLVISPYSSTINRVIPEKSVKGGLIYGDAMVGKTFFMLKYIVDRQKADLLSEEKLPTLYILQPYDIKVVENFMHHHQDKEKQIGIYWDWKHFAQIDQESFQKQKLLIVNAKFLNRSGAMKDTISKLHFHRIIIDPIEQIQYASPLSAFIRKLQTNIIWLITSQMTTNLITPVFYFLRLYEYFNYLGAHKDNTMELFECAFFRSLTYHIVFGKNQLTGLSGISMKGHIEIPRNHSNYPREQVMVSIRETLRYGAPKRMIGLLTLLSCLDSGVPMSKREVDDLLLYYSFNVRVGGSIFVVLPDLTELKKEEFSVDDPLCAICKEVMEDPARNTACRHAFCYECLKEWNRIRSSCPCCRAEFKNDFVAITDKSSDSVTSSSEGTSILGKKRRRDESDYKTTEELYVNHLREASLTSILQQKYYKKTLIVTHWRQMLHTYYEAARKADETKSIQVISKTMKYTESSRYDKIIHDADIIVTHADNINYFRKDDRFKQVIFMDNYLGPDSMCTWYNYFKHCLSRIYYYSELSVEKLLLNQMDDISKYNANIIGHNVTFPTVKWKDLLQNYFNFLRRG